MTKVVFSLVARFAKCCIFLHEFFARDVISKLLTHLIDMLILSTEATRLSIGKSMTIGVYSMANKGGTLVGAGVESELVRQSSQQGIELGHLYDEGNGANPVMTDIKLFGDAFN
jgi:translation initiation factor 6 (eIF-6)